MGSGARHLLALHAQRVASGVLLALAAGAFLYIAVLEVLAPEFKHPKAAPRQQAIALLAGFLGMTSFVFCG